MLCFNYLTYLSKSEYVILHPAQLLHIKHMGFNLTRDKNLIYKHYISLTVPSQIYIGAPYQEATNGFTSLPGRLPALCYANRQIRSECAPQLLLCTELFISGAAAAHSFTRYLREPFNSIVIPSIRMLCFSSAVSWCPSITHTNKALLLACSALQHVKLHVPPTLFVESWTETRSDIGEEAVNHVTACCDVGCEYCAEYTVTRWKLCSRKDVIERMDLCSLIDCEALEELTLVCPGEKVARRLGSTRELVFMPLLTWVRKNLCGSGKLRLRVDYGGNRVLGGRTLY